MIIVIVNQTATTLLWMMYHLGSYPDVQDQLYQEFERVVGKDGSITSNNIGKLSFLKACLKESMRYCVLSLFLLVSPNQWTNANHAF